MKAVRTNFAIAMLFLSYAAAQNSAGTATVQSITYARQGTDLRIELTLSSPVIPAAETAVHPDRILLDLPGAICTDRIKTVEIGSNGVRRVRTAQHSTDPIITRVVLYLDQAHPYTVKSAGNRIIVTVSSAVVAVRSGAPVAAKSASWTGIFRRQSRTPEVSAEENAPKPASEPPAATAKLGPYIPPSLTSPTPWFPFATSIKAEMRSHAGSVAPPSFPPVQVAPGAGGTNSSASTPPPIVAPLPPAHASTNPGGTSVE